MKVPVCFRDKFGKLRLKLRGWRLDNFPVLAQFFHLSLPKIGLSHPHKNYIFEIIKDRAIISQILAFSA